jgi:uncharacterized protein YndB with AHSA1/START domain
MEGVSRMRELRKEVAIAAPLEEVWKVWTDADALRFVSKRSNIELRIGGAYEWFLDLPPDAEGRRGGEGARVLAFLPRRMLAFDWGFPPETPTLRSSRAKTQVVVLFDEVEGGTRIQFAQTGWDDGAEWDAGYAYFDAAWDSVLSRMKGHLEAEHGRSAT